MSSLRTRKSATPTSAKRTPSTSKLSKPTKRPDADARKSRVDDRIKKRLSTRYADISGPTSLSGAPAVPSLPAALRPGGSGLGLGFSGSARDNDESAAPVVARPTKEELREAENKLLDSDEFDADAFMKAKLANSTEAELKSLQSSLQGSKDDVAVDLQRTVFKNYAEFVLISKEISTLENEMLELKESLAEWKSMPGVLHIDDGASAADRRRNVRSSLADLRVLYAGQMQALHSQIEGSAKFVPTTPGRHVVGEVDGVVALNAATYKPIHNVRFVLLDDAVLVARRRKRRAAGESERLVADRCWPLGDMLVLDTKDSAGLVNVFKIRHGKETHVYRTDTSADKKNLLAQFRSVAEELQQKRRREREGEHERRKTVWSASDKTGDDWMRDLAQQAGMTDSAKEKAERDARWAADFTDDLTVAIALREWERAVALVEQGESKQAVTPALQSKLAPLTASLTASLLQALSSPHNTKQPVVRIIHLLVRLHAGAAARTTFLSARAEAIKRLIRMIRFEGQAGVYVNDLAVVVFTAVKHTADWYLAAFKDNADASALVEWARAQVEGFASAFRRQVFGGGLSERAVAEEAVAIALLQHRKLLQESGIDFRFLLDDLLQENPPEKPAPPPTMVLSFSTASSSSSSSSSVTPRSNRTTPAPSRARTPNPPTTSQPDSSRPPIPPIPASSSAPIRSTTPSSTGRAPTPTSSGRAPTPTGRSSTPSGYRERERERERGDRPTTPSAYRSTAPSTPSRGASRPSTPDRSTAPASPRMPTPIRAQASFTSSVSSRSGVYGGLGTDGGYGGNGPESPRLPPRSRDRPPSVSTNASGVSGRGGGTYF
ncbi:unnamed protein product [Peniophora sp. CBMAI 1063]|nr:unnamed protein product [Peniophora sp. CBMAI 1063]